MTWWMYVANQTNLNLNSMPRVDANIFVTILQIIIGVTAALSLLFVTIGGLRYVISQGEPQAISKSKATIVYALIGLVIAIVAQALVTFVVRNAS